MEEEEEKIAEVLLELEKLGKHFGLSFIISLSKNESDLPEEVKGMIETSL